MSNQNSSNTIEEELAEFQESNTPVKLVLKDGKQLSGSLNWVKNGQVNLTEKHGAKRRITIQVEGILGCYELEERGSESLDYGDRHLG
ncbi:MAG: hypothetical protein ACLFN4_01875 [Candidatus Acetothermia bacterium]